jgi:L-lactate dehydrogenase (cytochrome)
LRLNIPGERQVCSCLFILSKRTIESSLVILRHAGHDATAAYSEVHPISTIETGLPRSKKLGPVDITELPSDWTTPLPPKTTTRADKPDLSTIINSHDFVTAAAQSLTPKAWAFYSSAATDTLTKKRNNSAYNEINLRPRIMVNVRDVDSSTTMLGQKLSTPIYCAPSSMAKLVHPQGEMELARGCRSAKISQCVSTSASFPVQDIFGAVTSTPGGQPDIPMFFQLYVDKNRSKSEKLLKEVERLGAKGIFVTVDAATAGKREADERVKADEGTVNPMSDMKAKNDKKGGALGRIMAGFIDPGLCWEDVPWLRKHTTLPICLKGVMTAMDAKLAMDAGIDGIVLSNHGGRNLDTSPAPILVLLELQKCCPEIFDRMEVFVDGGIMRGTDIFKALCLGAKAVSIGRGFLYALNYGEEGVAKFVESKIFWLHEAGAGKKLTWVSVLKDELEVTMKLCGITDLSQVHPGLLNTLAVDHLIPTSDEHPYAKWRPKARI